MTQKTSILILILGAASLLPAQETVAFDVVSIKGNHTASMNSGFKRFTGGMLNATNLTVKMLVAFAYDIPQDRISGGPAWLDTERYDIVAKPDRTAEGGAGKAADQSMDMIRRRTRTLLADRFKVTLRKEVRQLPVFHLVLANGGPKNLREPKSTEPDLINNGHHVDCRKASMAFFAKIFLTDQTGRPVLDKTGLTGDFDFSLDWTPDETSPRHPVDPSREAAAPDPLGPSLFAALQQQLGLKLESAKGPVDVLVIERAEKATEN